MKILHSIPYFAPAWDYGGPVRSCYLLSKYLARKGHEVTVYTTDNLNRNERLRLLDEIMDNVRVRRFRNISNTLSYRYNISTPYGLFRVPKSFSDFDVVHIHEYRTLQSILIRKYAKNYHIPYIIQARGGLKTFFQKGTLKKTYDRLWGNKILQDAARVIALAKIEAEEYKSLGIVDDKIEIVPNGIDPEDFEHLPIKGQFRKKYAINDNTRVILYLGRLHQIKGIDLLVKAFAQSTKELSNTRLVIVGPDDGFLGVVEGLVKELNIGDRVIFTGPLHGEARLAAYVDAEVYILPSFYEAFGVTVVEAMACGIPVIITEHCGLADDVNNVAGLVVPYDAEALSKAMVKMLGDESMRQEFGSKGRVLVREKFSWDRISDQVERLYRQILHDYNKL